MRSPGIELGICPTEDCPNVSLIKEEESMGRKTTLNGKGNI
jgi:hypothetical protein